MVSKACYATGHQIPRVALVGHLIQTVRSCCRAIRMGKLLAPGWQVPKTAAGHILRSSLACDITEFLSRRRGRGSRSAGVWLCSEITGLWPFQMKILGHLGFGNVDIPQEHILCSARHADGRDGPQANCTAGICQKNDMLGARCDQKKVETTCNRVTCQAKLELREARSGAQTCLLWGQCKSGTASGFSCRGPGFAVERMLLPPTLRHWTSVSLYFCKGRSRTPAEIYMPSGSKSTRHGGIFEGFLGCPGLPEKHHEHRRL